MRIDRLDHRPTPGSGDPCVDACGSIKDVHYPRRNLIEIAAYPADSNQQGQDRRR